MARAADSTYLVRIGWDPGEALAYAVAAASLQQTSPAAHAEPLVLRSLQQAGLYQRPRSIVDGRFWDVLSNAPMSTEHAIARFFLPWLHPRGWVLFTDGDVLFRKNIADLFALADDHYAVMCVQHPPLLAEGTKKDGQLQVAYPRKNWSSVMLFNCSHPANRVLDLDYLNAATGRSLHGFNWLNNDQIGALPPEWNYLVGVNPPMADPAIVHFTCGTPDLPAYAQSPFADEWLAIAREARL